MGRSPCCDKTRVKRGPWSQEEDAILRSFVQRFGNAGNWIALPQKAGLRRCGKSCRLRWLNYLRPELRHGGFTDEEDNLILSLYAEIGSKWSVMASRLPGRTDNDVKNYWNTKLKKRHDLDLASTTRQGRIRPTTTTSPPPAAPPPPSSDDSAAADRHDEPSLLPLTPPAGLADLDTAFVDTAAVVDDDMLMFKSEQLYAELVGLVQKQSQSQTTTTTGQSTGGDEAAAVTPSSSSGTAISPTVSSSTTCSGSGTGTLLWAPMEVHDTARLSSESSTCTASATASMFDAYGVVGDAFGTALPAAYSFLDLLASSSSCDDVTAAAATQELLYYQKY